MSITAKQSDIVYELVPSGNHIARCYSMIEIGTEESEFQGKKKKLYKVRVTWELPNEKKVFDPAKGEQPFTISKDYTLSMFDQANLRQDLESWRGKGFTEDEAKAFDITKLIGVPCMLNVIHKTSQKGGQYSAIASVTPIPKGLPAPLQINPSFVFSYDQWDDKKFAGLSEWVRGRIEKTPEFQARLGQVVHSDAPPDLMEPYDNSELPF